MTNKYPNLIKSGLKVGDTVDGIFGEMTVTSITNGPTFPIRSETKQGCVTFTEHGHINVHDAYPAIWFKSDTDWFNPPMSPPEPDHVKEFYTDRTVWVRDNNSDSKWRARYAAIYLPAVRSRFNVFWDGKKQSMATHTIGYMQVSYAKPEGAEDHE